MSSWWQSFFDDDYLHVWGTDRKERTAREVDGLWAVLSMEVYQLLVDRTGWSAARYEEWLADTIGRLLRPGRKEKQ